METRNAPRGLNAGLPSISTDDSFTRSKGPRLSPPATSSPMAMSIPNSNNYDEPPPPLPPPRFVPVDGPTVFDPRSRDHDEGLFSEDRESYKSRDHFYRPDLDEGYHSIGSARLVPSASCSGDFRAQPPWCFFSFKERFSWLIVLTVLILLELSIRRTSACTTRTSFDLAPMPTTAPCWTSSTPGGRWTTARQPSGLLLAPLQETVRIVRLRCNFPSSFPCRIERDHTSIWSTRLIDTTTRL